MFRRLLYLVLTAIAVLFALPSAAASVPLELPAPMVAFVLIALAAVAATLASTYRPALFSWRKAVGLPYEADHPLRLSM